MSYNRVVRALYLERKRGGRPKFRRFQDPKYIPYTQEMSDKVWNYVRRLNCTFASLDREIGIPGTSGLARIEYRLRTNGKATIPAEVWKSFLKRRPHELYD